MIRTAIFFILFALVLILSLIPALINEILKLVKAKEAQRKFVIQVTRIWAKLMILLTGNKVKTLNSERVPEGPVLYVMNHQSDFDIPVCLASLPSFAPFVAKVELEKVPVLSYWMKQMGCLFMDRADIRQSLRIILKGIDMLKNGQSLVIFPEGTRAKDGKMADFKPGSLKLAVKAKVPIVPITVNHSFKVFEEYNRIRSANVYIQIHDPIDTTVLTREEVNKLHVTVRNIINDSLEG